MVPKGPHAFLDGGWASCAWLPSPLLSACLSIFYKVIRLFYLMTCGTETHGQDLCE